MVPKNLNERLHDQKLVDDDSEVKTPLNIFNNDNQEGEESAEIKYLDLIDSLNSLKRKSKGQVRHIEDCFVRFDHLYHNHINTHSDLLVAQARIKDQDH